MPSWFVWVAVTMLVATLVTLTVAPGTTAPLGSVTVPVNVARVVWLEAPEANDRHTSAAIALARAMRMIFMDSIWHPLSAPAPGHRHTRQADTGTLHDEKRRSGPYGRMLSAGRRCAQTTGGVKVIRAS